MPTEAAPVMTPDKSGATDFGSAESTWEKLHAQPIMYGQPDKEGNVSVAVEFATPHETLDWSTNGMTNTPEREIVLQLEDGSLMTVMGQDAYYSKRHADGRFQVEKIAMDRLDDLKPVTLGEEPLQINGRPIGTVTSATVLWTGEGKRKLWNADEAANSGFRHETVDPFIFAEQNAEVADQLPPLNHSRRYLPDAKGVVYDTDVYTEIGKTIDWRGDKEFKKLNRQVMITDASGKKYYLYGDRLFDVSASEQQGKPVSVAMDLEQPLNNIEIGQAWESALGMTGPVTRVEVVTRKANLTKLDPNNSKHRPVIQDLFENPSTPGFRNEIAEAAAQFSPFASNGYEIPVPKKDKVIQAGKQVGIKAGSGLRTAGHGTKKVAVSGATKGIALGKKGVNISVKAGKKGADVGARLGKKGLVEGEKLARWTEDQFMLAGAYAMNRLVSIEPIRDIDQSDDKDADKDLKNN